MRYRESVIMLNAVGTTYMSDPCKMSRKDSHGNCNEVKTGKGETGLEKTAMPSL